MNDSVDVKVASPLIKSGAATTSKNSSTSDPLKEIGDQINEVYLEFLYFAKSKSDQFKRTRLYAALTDERGDVPGWVLVVLMTTGLVTAIWTIAAPRLTAILKNSLDAMNGIH
jgi:hypothetical protein